MGPGPPAASGGFTDHFDAYDAARWPKATESLQKIMVNVCPVDETAML